MKVRRRALQEIRSRIRKAPPMEVRAHMIAEGEPKEEVSAMIRYVLREKRARLTERLGFSDEYNGTIRLASPTIRFLKSAITKGRRIIVASPSITASVHARGVSLPRVKSDNSFSIAMLFTGKKIHELFRQYILKPFRRGLKKLFGAKASDLLRVR